MFTSLKDFQFPPVALYNLHNKESGKKYFGYQLTQRHLDRIVFMKYDQQPFSIPIKTWEFHKWEIEPAEEQEPKLTKEEQRFTFLPFVDHHRTFVLDPKVRYDIQGESGFISENLILTVIKSCTDYEYKFNNSNYAVPIVISPKVADKWKIRVSQFKPNPETKPEAHYWEPPKVKDGKTVFLPFEIHANRYEMHLNDKYDLEYKSGVSFFNCELKIKQEMESCWWFSHHTYGTIKITGKTQDRWSIRSCNENANPKTEPEVKELYTFKDFKGFNVFTIGVAYDLRSKVSPEHYERVYLSLAEGGVFLSAPSRKDLHRTVVEIPFINVNNWEYRESVIEEPTPKDNFTEERLREKSTFILDTLTEITNLLTKMHEEFVREGDGTNGDT